MIIKFMSEAKGFFFDQYLSVGQLHETMPSFNIETYVEFVQIVAKL